jgi:pilus assembly protein Flp/PilA
MLRLMRGLREDRSGPTAIEYGLIAGLLAIVIIAGLTSVGTSLTSLDNYLATAIGS